MVNDFDNYAYSKNDPRHNPRINDAMTTALECFGFDEVELRGEDYGADYQGVLFDEQGHPRACVIEAQRLVFWKEGNFPYDNINVFMRYARKPHTQPSMLLDTPCYHLWVRKDLGLAYVISWAEIRSHSTEVVVPTLRGDERMLSIPLELATRIEIPMEELDWWL